MAKGKRTLPNESSTDSESEASSKAKIGLTSRDTIEDGIKRLGIAVEKLRALSTVMQGEGLEEIRMQGPKSLKRGVNAVLGFTEQLATAMEKRNRM